MYEYENIMEILDYDEEKVLYRLKNDIFDSAVLVYHDGEPSEECYILTDMQGPFPATLEDVPNYDWALAEDANW